jgi:hypothetical protein
MSITLTVVFTGCENTKRGHKTESREDSISTIETQTTKETDVPYRVAERYFIKNSVREGALLSSKIETQEAFESIFGAAATMGKNGTPSKIDFGKQYVIALAGNTTDTLTDIKPVFLRKNGTNDIVLTYSIIKGERQSFLIRPCLLIIVDKSYDGTVILNKQN